MNNLDAAQLELGFVMALLRGAIGASPLGVVALADGRVYARNGAAIDLLGSMLEPSRVEDWPETFRLFDPSTRELIEPGRFVLCRLAGKPESLVQELYHELPSGSRQRLTFTARSVRTPAIDGAICFIARTGSGW